MGGIVKRSIYIMKNQVREMNKKQRDLYYEKSWDLLGSRMSFDASTIPVSQIDWNKVSTELMTEEQLYELSQKPSFTPYPSDEELRNLGIDPEEFAKLA